MRLIGSSSGRGFFIIDRDNNIFLATSGRRTNSLDSREAVELRQGILKDDTLKTYLVALVLSFLFCWLAVGLPLFWSIYFSIILAFFLNEIGLVAFFLVFVSSTHREYHGCEHKVVNLLESGREPSIENLRGASAIHKRCGTDCFSWLSHLRPYNFFILQRFVTTKEPNLSILEEGLEVVKKYKKIEGEKP